MIFAMSSVFVLLLWLLVKEADNGTSDSTRTVYHVVTTRIVFSRCVLSHIVKLHTIILYSIKL